MSQVETLMGLHVGWAERFGRGQVKRLPPSFDIEDLVQAARIGLWKAAARYQAELNDSFRAFASTYVRGEVMMAVRRRNYTEAVHEELGEERCGGETPETLRARGERIEEAGRLLARLGGKDRRILSLVYIDEVPVPQVARRLRVSEAAAYGLVRKAMARARELREPREAA